MDPSGQFDPTKTYDSYKAVEVLDPSCTECLTKGKDCFDHYNPRSSKCHYCFIGKKPCCHNGKQASNLRRYLWSKKHGPFEKEFPDSEAPTLDEGWARWTNVGGPIPVGDRPIYSGSEVPISRINTEGLVKKIRQIANSPPNLGAEVSDELDGEEVEVVPNSAGHPSNNSPSQPPVKRFQSQIIPSTPRSFQPTLASIPPASPHSSHTRPALNPEARPTHIQQVFQCREQWPIRVTREDPNMASENQDAVARPIRRVDGNSREVIMYANDRTIQGDGWRICLV
ncbi:hypothetical protein O181_005769 [Austropuccinia psidii MF-1]|uniref:Uncharacterized protein n=1 Tax=Austropuccinia psidii MF-1 TaxID=1389203 RepID=A0A9Q3BIS1_9BASI|nr:hypothetical protein [Austropuccinia psidii MF-1]